MPFGLQGAPATFQRMVDKLLNGLNEFAGAYIDDVIVFSKTWSDHLHHLEGEDSGGGANSQAEKVSIRHV